MSLINLKRFWTKNPLGRTLSGRNKTGQVLTSIVNPLLIATGLKGTVNAVGNVTGAEELEEIAESKKKPVSELKLNLSASQERGIKLAIFATIIILTLLGVDVATIVDAISSGIEHLNALIDSLNSLNDGTGETSALLYPK